MSTSAVDTRVLALAGKVAALTSTEHEELYRMLVAHNARDDGSSKVALTHNANGVFFDLSGVEPELLARLEKFVEYCGATAAELERYDRRLSELAAAQTRPAAAAGAAAQGAPAAPELTQVSAFIARLTRDAEDARQQAGSRRASKANTRFTAALKKFSRASGEAA